MCNPAMSEYSGVQDFAPKKFSKKGQKFLGRSSENRVFIFNLHHFERGDSGGLLDPLPLKLFFLPVGFLSADDRSNLFTMIGPLRKSMSKRLRYRHKGPDLESLLLSTKGGSDTSRGCTAWACFSVRGSTTSEASNCSASGMIVIWCCVVELQKE